MKYIVITLFLLVSSINNASANSAPCAGTDGDCSKISLKTELFVRFLTDKLEFIKSHWSEDYAFISDDLNLFFCPFDTRQDNTKDLDKIRIGGDNLGSFYVYSYPPLPCNWLSKPDFEQHIKNRKGITTLIKYKLAQKEALNFNGVLTSSRLNSGFLITWE